MKKVLSLVLVAVLAIGMGSAAFANWGTWADIVDLENIKGYAPSYGLIDGYDGTYTVNTNQGIVYGGKKSGVINMGKVYATDKPGLDIKLWNYMFQGVNVNSGSTTEYYYYTPDLDKMYARGLIKLNTVYTKTSDVLGWGDYENVAVGSWKMQGAGGLVDKLGLSSSSMSQADWAQAIGNFFYTNGMMKVEKYSNSKKTLYFYQGYNVSTTTWMGNFTGDPIVSSESKNDGSRLLTITEIQKSEIKLNVQVKGSSSPIKKIELVPSKGVIEFRTQDEWVSTDDAKFEVVFFLTINGTRYDDETVTITGTLDNKRIKVYANMDYVDISEGYIAEPVDFNSKIAVNIGNGVTIHTKMFKDKLYYGITKREADDAATIVFNQYKDVSNVITLRTVGFANTNDYVTLSTDWSGYYVYDADMNYLGKADEQLEFSTRYYLADKKLDLDEEEEDDDDDDDSEPTPAGNPSTGGDNSSPNINANPGTGC